MGDAAPHETAALFSATMKLDGTRLPTPPEAVPRNNSSAMDVAGDEHFDVDAMLTAMQQSARQLDEMLQRMCVATSASSDTSDDNDDGVHTSTVSPVDLLTSDETIACEIYYEAIRSSLSGAHRTGVQRVSHHALRRLMESGEQDLSKQLDDKTFRASTSDVTYMFPVTSAHYTTHEDEDGDENEEEWDMAEALSLSAFQQRIVQALESIDHAIPSAVAHAMATGVTQKVMLVSRADCELQAIQSLFPVTHIEPDTHVEWRRGNRICKVHATERQRRRQWGVELTLTLETVARAQGLSMTNDGGSAQLGPALSCAVECRTFMPKASYKSATLDLLSVRTKLTLALASEGDRKASAEGTHDETVANEADAVLPEFLNVFQWGGHAVLSSSSESPMAVPATFHSSTGFQRMDVRAPFPRNRIVQVACGRLHTLLLNDVGMVLSYGHVMDGALGHGDALRRTEVVVSEPTLVTYFFEKAIPIQSVACGGDDLTGFHSAAVARDGSVYTWGVGVALGQGSIKSKSTPERVPIPSSSFDAGGEPTPIVSISCGSGFCVALGGDGSAFAWGKWSDGRLGLGAIPILHKSSRHHGHRRQLQRFQLTPKQLPTCTRNGSPVRWRKVSCGDAHCVALSRTGLVYVWGRGREGQLGLGNVLDAMAPVAVMSKKVWRDVAAGQDWSMAADARGAVWSWGACGAAVLGLSYGDDADRGAIVAQVLLQKHFQLRQQTQGNKITLTPPPRFHWLRPQPIPSLSHGDAAIRSISAGVHHAAAISERGDLYVWGSPQHGLAAQPTLVINSSSNQGDDTIDARGSSGIGSTIAERVFCGGSQVIALTSGTFLAKAMQQLYHTLQTTTISTNAETGHPHGEQQPPAGADVALIVGGGHVLFAHKLVLSRRSPVLRNLIVNEERPLDSALGATTSTAAPVVTEILLPQLRAEIARILVEFIYTDNLTQSLNSLSYLIRDVLRAAREFQIPLLVHICRERIASASYVPLPTLLDDLLIEDDDQAEDDEGEATRRDHSLNDDLAFAFGDAKWADFRIIAETRAIPVHRCMLLARSAYFRALLAFYDQQEVLSTRVGSTRELVVDESYLGMVRVLKFIYNDELATVTKHHTRSRLDPMGQPAGEVQEEDAEEEDDDEEEEGRTEQLLEDLIAADKYGLVRMKRLCEHHIVVTTTNCLDVLVVADLVHAEHLKQVAMAFVHANLHILSEPSSAVLSRLAHEFPHLLTELYDRLHRHTQQQTLVRDWQRHVENDARAQQQQQNQKWQETTQHHRDFPWVPLMLAFVFATLYLYVMNAQESDYPFVPAINLVVIGGLLAAAFAGKL